MVRRIVILNSGVYGKASIRFDDCNSIQLVGPNNIGKSTLIYALNFLFIIDGKKMSFSGNNSEKDTLHHYFPTQTQSYMLFEIFKQRYYCILIKRGEDGLEYFKIDSNYNEELFLQIIEKQQRVLKFEEVRGRILSKGIELHEFRDKKEVFSFIYQRGKKNNAAIWLEDKVVSEGISNNFSKVYRYLINSKLINNHTLKDTLIIADNRDREGINFSQKDRRDILSLLKANDEIKIYESIKADFYAFKEVVSHHRAKENIVRELISAFDKQYSFSIIEFEVRTRQKKVEVEKMTFEVNEKLKPLQQGLDRDIGGLESKILTETQTASKLQGLIDEINSFESREFLQQALVNLDEKRKEIETRLNQIDTRDLSLKQVENKISSIKSLADSKSREITNFSKRLIQNIASSQEIKEKINFILSGEFLAGLTNEDVSKKITKLDEIMNLFDGRIKIPEELKSKPIASLEQLNEDVKQLKSELLEYERLLPIIRDVESKRAELRRLKDSIYEYSGKIKKIDSKIELESEINSCKTSIKLKSEEKEKKEKELKLLIEEINLKTESIKILNDQKRDYEGRLNTIRDQKLEIEALKLEPIESESPETLENIFRKIRIFNKDREELKGNKERLFDKLKDRIKSTLASENDLIKFVDEEIACLPDKRNSIDGYLQAISVQFANPCASLLRRYNEFKEYVYNEFNSKLRKTKFSDIESLKIVLVESKSIHNDLRQISLIQDLKGHSELDFGQTDNLVTLNKFLDSGKKIEFEDLFEIELLLTKGGREQKVDLKNQVESDGTDRMIRLVIIMSVINKLAINDKNNKIVIFIDEIATIDGNNRRELFNFCREHNFIPICASPDETILDGFDKYVLLFRPQKGSKVNINEKQPNVIFQERLVDYERN